jgi:hypothetical protein
MGRAEQCNAKLHKVKEVQEVDDMMQESPGPDVMPEKVVEHIGECVLPFFVFLSLVGWVPGDNIGIWSMSQSWL